MTTRPTRTFLAAISIVCVSAIGLAATTPAPADATTQSGDSGAIAGGSGHTCALNDLGGVQCWGANTFGALGDGTTQDRLTPVPVVGLESGVVAVTAGIDHTCALTDTGGVTCWGLNTRGQLGDGTTTSRLSPVDVVGLTSGVTAIAAGNLHTCALTDTGGVKCWGSNGGALGDGTTTERSSPVDVVGLTSGVTAIAPGANHTCALTDIGGVKCWGHNSRGGLGDGTTTVRLTPVDVIGLASGVTFISAYGNLGGQRSSAVTSGGGLKCWGDNTSAQLGDGTTTNRLTPVDVVGLTSGVAAVTTGTSQTCALTDEGGVKCWGQFGVGDGVYSAELRTTPVDVVGLGSGVDEIDSGGFHVCAVRATGGIACWGGNGRGQLGQGLTEATWPQAGRIPRDVSGSFYRDECPTLVREARTDYSMTDGYAVGSSATFVADPGYALTGAATLTCQPDLSWDGTVPSAVTTGAVEVVPGTGLRGGDLVEVTMSGFAPLAGLGWAQCVVLDPPTQNNCSAPIGQAPADATGSLATQFRLQRFLYVPALDDWVDCTDATESCVMAAADVADILGSAATTPLDFAPPPDPPSGPGDVVLDPALVSGPGETVTVTGSGFEPNAWIDVYQCASDPADPSACNRPVASMAADGSGGFVADVVVEQLVEPPGGAPTDCFAAPGACVIAAADAVDFPGTVTTAPFEQPPPVRIVPGVAELVEGPTGTTQDLEIPVSLSRPSDVEVTAEWDTIFAAGAPDFQATAGQDYEIVSDGVVTFAPGETEATVTVEVSGDWTVEPYEYFVVSVHDPTNAVMGGFWGLGFGGIINDDVIPEVVPGSESVDEGNDGPVTVGVPVILSGTTDSTVTVEWETTVVAGAPLPAVPPDDYVAASGTVTFEPGVTSATIDVTVNGDLDPETDELVIVSFHDPTGATVGGFFGLGFVVILDDD